MTIAYLKARRAQMNASARGFARAPLGNVCKLKAPYRPPMAAPPPPAPIGTLGSPAHLGELNKTTFLGIAEGMTPWKLVVGLGLNYAVVYGLIEIFPVYMKDSLSRHVSEDKKRKAKRRISLITAAVVTGLNSIAIPLLATKDD